MNKFLITQDKFSWVCSIQNDKEEIIDFTFGNTAQEALENALELNKEQETEIQVQKYKDSINIGDKIYAYKGWSYDKDDYVDSIDGTLISINAEECCLYSLTEEGNNELYDVKIKDIKSVKSNVYGKFKVTEKSLNKSHTYIIRGGIGWKFLKKENNKFIFCDFEDIISNKNEEEYDILTLTKKELKDVIRTNWYEDI